MGLANSMGLFLQKTNIIRDYLEDYVDGRAFWPQSLWRSYAHTRDLGEFARPTARYSAAAAKNHGSALAAAFPSPAVRRIVAKGASDRALRCLDALVADALLVVPDALEYLRRLRTPRVYRFCAIPQVMAIATLDECFDNPKLFTGVVKIRKGTAARIILESQTHDATLEWFDHFARSILKKLPASSADEKTKESIQNSCLAIVDLAHQAVNRQQTKRNAVAVVAVTLAVGALALVVDFFK